MDLFQRILDFNYVIGFGVIAIGVGAVFVPQRSSKGYGIEIAGAGLAFVQATGVRDIFMGLALIIVKFSHHFVSLLSILFAIAFVASIDFFIVFRKGRGRAYLVHAVATILVLAYAGVLIALAPKI